MAVMSGITYQITGLNVQHTVAWKKFTNDI